MLPPRIAARLDIKGPNVIKGIRFEGLRIIGSPAALARQYTESGADEIFYTDIVASLYGRSLDYKIVESVAEQTFLPLTVCGGIRSLDDVQAALRHGADKVAINTAAIKCPRLIDEIALAYGSQCITISVEAKRRSQDRWEAYTLGGRQVTGVNVLDWVVEAEKRGAGEILLNSVDQDGTGRGFDLDLIAAVRSKVSIPLFISGGAGSVAHVESLFASKKVEAIACASLLHKQRDSIEKVKKALKKNHIEVRA